jgi:glycosyltransferase involved in cell wall biosynthesis
MDLRNWQNIHGLTNIGDVGVLGLHSNDDRRRQLPPLELAFWRASSDPDLSYPLPKKKLEGRAWLLDPLGHPSDLYYSDAAAAEIDEIMGSFKPQIVVMEGLWLHRYISRVKRHRCRLVLDLHAVEAAMFGEIAASTAGEGLRAKLFRNVLPDRVKVIERQAVNAVDQIWLCSEEDVCLMKELYGPSAPICLVPNTVDIAHYEAVRTGLCPRPESVAPSRRTVIFPAVFQWEPNATAAQFLIEEVFPDLARVFPDCQLLLVGGLPTPFMVAAAEREPRIVVTGVVPDMLPFFGAATVMAVPLWQGGGTRLKILEGLASNVPIVSTRKGAEGLEVENGTQLLFAENAGEFIAEIKRIWTDESLVKNLVTHGMALMTRAYSWDVSDRRIRDAIAVLNGDSSDADAVLATPEN